MAEQIINSKSSGSSSSSSAAMRPRLAGRLPPSILFFNPRDKSFNSDPYPHYARLRETDPVHKSPLGIWFVGGYDEVRAIFRDKRFAVEDIPGKLRNKEQVIRDYYRDDSISLSHLIRHSEHWLPFNEPPKHSRLRSLLTKAFQIKSVEKMRPVIRQVAEDLLQSPLQRGGMDIITDYGCQLSPNVIATIIGVPRADFGLLHQWSVVMGRIFDPLVSVEEYQQLDNCSREFMDYLADLIQQRRRRPKDDLVSALIQAKDNDQSLSTDEMIACLILLFGAGEETVATLIGNGSLALLRNPGQYDLLRERPDLMPQAVEEFLRYDAPLQMTSRNAQQDVEILGKTIAKGEQVYLLIGSANRDPSQFDNPDQLDITRNNIRHMSFVEGHHFCLGAQLARMEAQEAFSVLLQSRLQMKLQTEQLQWRDHTVLRCLKSLPISFG